MGVVLGPVFCARLEVLFWYGRLDKGSEPLKETIFGSPAFQDENARVGKPAPVAFAQ